MQQETQLINEKDYRFKTLIGYTKELKEKKNELMKSFKNNKNNFNRISIANYSVSSIAVGSATTGIVTAVTVIGLPITVVASALSGILGVTSIVLTSFQKNTIESLLKRKNCIQKFLKQLQI